MHKASMNSPPGVCVSQFTRSKPVSKNTGWNRLHAQRGYGTSPCLRSYQTVANSALACKLVAVVIDPDSGDSDWLYSRPKSVSRRCRCCSKVPKQKWKWSKGAFALLCMRGFVPQDSIDAKALELTVHLYFCLILPLHCALERHDVVMQVHTKDTGAESPQSLPAEWLEVAQSQVLFCDNLNGYWSMHSPSDLKNAFCVS
jgi:hypothetical protein